MDGDAALATLIEAHRGPWTSDDLDAFPDHWKVEILDGTLIVNAAPNAFHQAVAQRIQRVFEDQVDDAPEALCGIALTLGASEFIPDVSILHRDRIAWRAKTQAADTALLVVEVASPSTSSMDRYVKREKYAAAGIAGYWRVEVDPVVTVIAYALRDGEYAEVGTWREGETVEVDTPCVVRFDPATLRP